MQWLDEELSPGSQPLAGKTFYLDGLKSKHAALLVEAIGRLGGKVESFLSKDVSFVLSGSREARGDCGSQPAAGTAAACSKNPARRREGRARGSQRSVDSEVCGSRGKVLLGKVIRNSEEHSEGSSVLAQARSWAIKILHVDDFLAYVEQGRAGSFQFRKGKPEKTVAPGPAGRVIKAGRLKQPFVKVEDSSRCYRPLYQHFVSFPELDFTRPDRFSPFVSPLPPGKEEDCEQNRVKNESRALTSSEGQRRPGPAVAPAVGARRPQRGFCECCHQTFPGLSEHLQSEQHRLFAQDSSHYSVVDRLISQMLPEFVESQVHHSQLMRVASPPAGCLEPPCELTQGSSEAERHLEALLSLPGAHWPEDGPGGSLLPACGAGATSPAPEAGRATPTGPRLQAVQPREAEAPEEDEPQQGGARDSRLGAEPEHSEPGKPTLSVIPSPRNLWKRQRSASTSPRARKIRRTSPIHGSDPTFHCLSAVHHVDDEERSPRLRLSTPAGEVVSGLQQQDPASASGPQDMAASAVDKREPARAPAHEDGSPSGAILNEKSHASCRAPLCECHVWCSQSHSPSTEKGQNPAVPQTLLGYAGQGISACFGAVHPRLLEEQCPSPFLPTRYQPGSQDLGPVPKEREVRTVSRQQCASLGFSALALPPCPADPPSSCLSRAEQVLGSCVPHLQSFSSESDWDCGLLSQLGAPPAAREQGALDLEVLRLTCAGVQDSGYEARLCSVLLSAELEWAAGAGSAAARCGSQTDPLGCRALEAGPV
ncbi:protein DBF4 homolog A [Lepisosteus oculatus]|uniref:protein DBF4 homolog A n=1 Tax=Lepisosteus oculatus TaxID=7918 RepID=UPI0037116A01